MPYTDASYPISMKNLEPAVRRKAIEIANALLEDDYAEGSAIPIAIAQAKRWAENHDGDDPALNLHVVPHPKGWAVRRADSQRSGVVFETEADARNHALQQAAGEGVAVIFYAADGQSSDYVKPLPTLPEQVMQTVAGEGNPPADDTTGQREKVRRTVSSERMEHPGSPSDKR